MHSFSFHPSPVLGFIAGMALLWTAALIYWKQPLPSENRRLFLAAFALSQALSEWCGVGVSATGSLIFAGAQVVLSAVSFMALVELAKRELKFNGQPVIKWWVYPLVLGICGFKYWWAGWEGLELASRYAIALPGGVLATVAIARGAAEKRPIHTATALMAAAVAVFAAGRVFDVAALRAFAAMGFLASIWRLLQEIRRWSGEVSALRRWRMPLAFLLIAVAGSIAIGITIRPQDTWTESLATAANGAAGGGSAASGGEFLDRLPVDARQVARDRAEQQRYKQGLVILVVVGVVAVVWVGLAHLPRAK